MAILPEIRTECLEELTKNGFKLGTAYMEVPRCDHCKHWATFVGAKSGTCTRLGFASSGCVADINGPLRTWADFGCVEFENK